MKPKTLGSLVFAGLAVVFSISVANSAWVIKNGEGAEYSGAFSESETIVPVCYISETGAYYTSLDTALDDAYSNSGTDTIYVLPGLGVGDTTNLPNTTQVHISENHTISGSDQLILPYSGTDYKNRESTTTGFADDDLASIKSNLKTEVILDEGVTLTIGSSSNHNAKLRIGGIVGNASVPLAGQTSSSYCQISMMSNSKIVNYGTIDCLGYIKEYDESAEIKASGVYSYSGSTIYLPIVFYDYRGGNDVQAYYKAGLFPISVFDFPNIQTLVSLAYGASMEVYCGIYISTLSLGHVLVPGTISLVSSSETAVFQLTSGTFQYDYSPASSCTIGDRTAGLTVSDLNTAKTVNGVLTNAAITNIKVEGSFTAHDLNVDFSEASDTLKLELNTILGTTNITSSGKYFPLCWKYHFELGSGTYNFPLKVAFYPGSSLEINEGAVCNITSSACFLDSYLGLTGSNRYPTTLPASSCVNNGVINVSGSFGGYVKTSNLTGTAQLVFEESASYSVVFTECVEIESGLIMDSAKTSDFTIYSTAYIAIFSEDEAATLSGKGTTFTSTSIESGDLGFNLWESNAEVAIQSAKKTFTTVQDKGSGYSSQNKSTANVSIEIVLSVDYDNIDFVWSCVQTAKGDSYYADNGTPSCSDISEPSFGKATATISYDCRIGTSLLDADNIQNCWVEYTFTCVVKDSITGEDYASGEYTFRLYAYLNGTSSGWVS